MDIIPSKNVPLTVRAFGFPLADAAAHMIYWLGRGPDFRRFVTNDVEGELYAQTPGAQLLSITCKETPRLETYGAQNEMRKGIVATDVCVTFLLALQIKTVDSVLWHLDVEHSYIASNVHLSDDRRKLTQNFTVMGCQKEFPATK